MSCTIRNYRPQDKEVSGAEYIRKREFKAQNKFQNDGLPSGIYGFITNLDGNTSDDERMRIGREKMTGYVMNRAFFLNNQETSIDNDEYDKKLDRYELFRVLAFGMIYQAQIKIGKVDEHYHLNNEHSSYHINNLEKYKAELGIISPYTVKQAIDLFVEEKYDRAEENDLLLSPIRYLLENYDGICNYANNTAGGGSVFFTDLKPRAGTMGGFGNLYSFQSKKGKKAKSPKNKKNKSKTKSKKSSKKAKNSKKSPKKRKSVKKVKNPKKSIKKRSKLL